MRPRPLVPVEDRRDLPAHLTRCRTEDCGVVILRSAHAEGRCYRCVRDARKKRRTERSLGVA